MSLTAFTINDLYSRFINYLDVSPKTIDTYSKAIKQFLKWLSAKSIASPTREHVLAFKKELQDNHKATTVQNYIVALRQFFCWTATFVLMLTGGLRTIEVERAIKDDIRTVADQTVLFIQGKGREDKTDYIKLSAPVEKVIRDKSRKSI